MNRNLVAVLSVTCIAFSLFATPYSVPAQAAKANSGMEAAIGRLNYAGFRSRGHCTAFLVDAKTVLTARHCVEKWPMGDLRLVLGYDRGDWKELHTIKAIHRHPVQDVATLCIKKKSRIKPLTLDLLQTSRTAQAVKTQGYPKSRPHMQSTLSCFLQPARRSARMECPVEQGMSGSPVMASTSKGPRVIGIASGTAAAFSIIERLRDTVLSSCK